jgi:hypothetical protein
MDQSRTHDIHQVSDVENVFLIEPYTKEEVKKKDVFQMKHNNAP